MTGERIAKAALVGVLAGLLSGLFGVGGGVLMVPAFVAVMHLDQRLAHGVSLTAVVPIAISSTLSYSLAGEVDWAVAACLAVGGIAGAVVGTHLLSILPQRVLAVAFASVLVATAIRMLVDQSDAPGRDALGVWGAVALVAVGLASGILAGLLGVGGGTIMVPAMVVGLGMGATSAKGTSLAVIIPTAVMGTWRNLRNGNTDVRLAAVAGLAGVVSAFIGGRISVGMSEVVANSLFAALLLVVAAQMVWRLVRER